MNILHAVTALPIWSAARRPSSADFMTVSPPSSRSHPHHVEDSSTRQLTANILDSRLHGASGRACTRYVNVLLVGLRLVIPNNIMTTKFLTVHTILYPIGDKGFFLDVFVSDCETLNHY